ncbi:unannotated protein [freshwater metagenome]|uniref:Unannotated protein n=1 Tax=freshwater metagenome TaxID=449393 RepID=A0A6J7GGM0_9ZZZZ
MLKTELQHTASRGLNFPKSTWCAGALFTSTPAWQAIYTGGSGLHHPVFGGDEGDGEGITYYLTLHT